MRSSFFHTMDYKPCPSSGSRGFTIVELMIVIALISVVATVGVPNFMTFIENNRVTTATNSYVGTLNYARSQATREGRNVQVQAREEDDWAQGIEAMLDNDTLRVSEAVAGSIQVSGEEVTFRGNGMATGAAEFQICTEDGGYGRRININEGGQIRTREADCS